MILARHIKDYRIILGIGQVCMVLGLVGLRLSGLFGGDFEKTFWNGFLADLSGILLGLSVPLNLTALIRGARARRAGQ